MNEKLICRKGMTDRRTFFGVDKMLVERIDSLDEKWFVEFWVIRYYFLGIEVYTKKKEIIKHNGMNNHNHHHAYR